MPDSSRFIPKDEVIRTLHRAGFEASVVDELAAKLPDPVDLDQAEPLLTSYGITRAGLEERMGGSP